MGGAGVRMIGVTCYECQASADVTVYGGMLGPRMCAVGKLSGFYNK